MINVYLTEESVMATRAENVKAVVGILRCHGLISYATAEEKGKPICIRVEKHNGLRNGLIQKLYRVGADKVEVKEESNA